MNNGYSTYKATSVETADKGKLIIICYDVAIKQGTLALDLPDHYTSIEKRMRYLYKMQDAITELLIALDLSTGDIARNLYSLYEYMLHRITEAITTKENEPIREILTYLSELRDAWKVAIVKVKETNTATTGRPAGAMLKIKG